MASLDPRVYQGIRPPPSSASSPSLRSRDSAVMAPAIKAMDGGGNVKVVVRVRGFLPREIERGAECLVSMDPDTEATTLHVPISADPANSKTASRRIIEDKNFTFDSSFWSFDPKDAHYAHQEDVYNTLGESFLDHNFEGYHTCIFAYGQTGAGKSYTMMGTPQEPGLIPRTCEDLFERIENADSPTVSYSVRVSYFEVYNEHVRDLLVPRTETPYYLKIRESPTEGPYVKDLTESPVKNFTELMRYMRAGDASRTTASTRMNNTSSRSHAVFTIHLKSIQTSLTSDSVVERCSRIRLVDLAGSERAASTLATGARLREGSNINKSLTTLGRVIAALAERRPTSRKKEIVPYRDSILTWLLKDSLGGNSKTAMIACVSPADYDESLSTLRYADQAKRIRTRAVVNQDSVSSAERDAQINDLKETIRELQLSLHDAMRLPTAPAMTDEQKIDDYRSKVDKMQRLMEDNADVAECKLRALGEQNEALRRHLHLALDSLRNPINYPTTPNSSPPTTHTPVQNRASVGTTITTSSGAETPDMISDVESLDEDEEFEADESKQREREEHARGVQEGMKSLLRDLGLFRRKVGDDTSRWKGSDQGVFG
ncbi:MAG: Kinesin [Vezdaea aestivalis]|nr:MAG: Kinesin [Vezdaea aestivalis]